MRTCTFKVVLEPDEGGFHAYCPALRYLGAVTQGSTKEEALKNVNEVVQMIVDELLEEGSPGGVRRRRSCLRGHASRGDRIGPTLPAWPLTIPNFAQPPLANS